MLVIKADLIGKDEEYYKKQLLLDKIKPSLSIQDKAFILSKECCIDYFVDNFKETYLLFHYIQDKPLTKFEERIKTIPLYASIYACDMKGERWHEAEEFIAKDPALFFLYNLYFGLDTSNIAVADHKINEIRKKIFSITIQTAKDPI